MTTEHDAAVHAGQEVYSERVLRIYDLLVLGLTNRFVWRCPRRRMRELYRRGLGGDHLELGAGSGYFLDRCPFPVPDPLVTLVDLNPATLRFASQRLSRYRTETALANVFEPLPFEAGRFDSVAMNMLLHCLPGEDLFAKQPVLAGAARVLRPGGKLFGSTILAGGVPLTRPASAMLRNHNERGILHNLGDALEDLRAVLGGLFADCTVTLHGNMALFEAVAPEGNGSA